MRLNVIFGDFFLESHARHVLQWPLLSGLIYHKLKYLKIINRNYLISSSLWPLPLLSRFRWACHLACALNASLINVIANLNISLFRLSRLCHLLFLQWFLRLKTIVSKKLNLISWLWSLSSFAYDFVQRIRYMWHFTYGDCHLAFWPVW